MILDLWCYLVMLGIGWYIVEIVVVVVGVGVGMV